MFYTLSVFAGSYGVWLNRNQVEVALSLSLLSPKTQSIAKNSHVLCPNLSIWLKAIVIAFMVQALSYPANCWGQGSGNTLTFDGVNDGVSLGNMTSDIRTIEMWFKPDVNIANNLQTVLSLIVRDFNAGSGLSTNEFGLNFNITAWGDAGAIQFFRRVGSTQHKIHSNSNFWASDTWYHIAVVIDPVQGMRMHVNGVLQAATEPSTDPIFAMTGSALDNVGVGQWGNLSIRFFEGQIDEVRVWSTARSELEIRTNMCKKLAGNEPGLFWYYRFDTGAGNTLVDSSPTAHNGTLLNMNPANWETSAAPIGDLSAFSYSSNWSGQQLDLNFATGDQFSVSQITGPSEGIHIYRVGSLPNTTSGISGTGSLNSYYGVFLTGISGGYDMNYLFSANASNCGPCSNIYARNDNAGTSWLPINANINSSCSGTKTGESSSGNPFRSEYIVSMGAATQLSLGTDTTLCEGSSFLLDASITGGSYIWSTTQTTPTISATSTGLYSVTATANNCSATDSILVSFIPLPEVSLGPDTSICSNDSVVLTPLGTALSFLWSNGLSGSSIMVSNPGIYWVRGGSGSCVKSDTIQIGVEPGPTVNLGEDQVLCIGSTVQLNALFSEGTYLWSDGSTSPSLTVSQSGDVWVEVTFGNCSANDTVKIDFFNPSLVSVGNDTSLCPGDTIVLDAKIGGVDYAWNTGSISQMLVVTEAGNYSVTVSVDGCSGSDEVEIEEYPLPMLTFPMDTLVCDMESFVLSAQSPNATYAWSTGSSASEVTINQDGNYQVTATLGNCKSFREIDVLFGETPHPNLGPDTTICNNSFFTLQSSLTNFDLSWNDGSSLDSLVVDADGFYWVSATSDCGVVSDSIHLEKVDCSCPIYIPNAFTPNGDGMNDLFGPKSACRLSFYEFWIYNRWGETIFKSNDISLPWNGSFQGQLSQAGVYTWHLWYSSNFFNPKADQFKSGRVTVLKNSAR